MRTHAKRAFKWAWRRLPDDVFVLCVLGFAVCLWFITGCAAGRNDATGEIVIGFGAGRLTESVNQGLSQLGDYILPGAGAALAAVGLPVIGWARSYAAARANAAAHAAENKGFDEGAARSVGSVSDPITPPPVVPPQT